MSGVYPVLPGLTYTLTKTANWGTRMQRAVSGRTLRTSDFVNPIWNFTLQYSVLEDRPGVAAGNLSMTAAPNALRQLLDFFNSQAGAFDSFLFDDVNDDTALGQLCIPVPSDPTGTQLQLTRQLVVGGFHEWINAPNVVSQVYFNGTPVGLGQYTVDPTSGIITFSSAIGGGITVSADFTYYFRCYLTDSLDFDYFAYKLAELKQVKLTSVVL